MTEDRWAAQCKRWAEEEKMYRKMYPPRPATWGEILFAFVWYGGFLAIVFALARLVSHR